MIEFLPASSSLRVLAEPLSFPLPDTSQDRIKQIWHAENTLRGGRLFNGKLFSVQTVSPDRITGGFIEYRWYVAQRRDPGILDGFTVRPLAVSGIVSSLDGLIFGKRCSSAMDSPNMWELVPSGGVDERHCGPGIEVSYIDQFLDETREELGISADDICNIMPTAILEDRTKNLVEICISADTPLQEPALMMRFSGVKREHSMIRVVKQDALGPFVGSLSEEFVPETLELLRLLRLV
jgi:hypothetical protein